MNYNIYIIAILAFLLCNFSFAEDKSLHKKYHIKKPHLSEHAKDELAKSQYMKVSDLKELATKINTVVPVGTIQNQKSNQLKKIAEPISIGQTFKEIQFSEEHNISVLTKNESKLLLNRELFGSIDKSASYYSAKYFNTAPFVQSTYLQFITDPAWNRILYGNMNNWIKSIDNIPGPSAVEVDASGRVFIGSTTENKIYVFQIVGEGENISLNLIFTIDNIFPSDISLNDNGTPVNIADDFLFIADANSNKIYKFKLHQNHAEKIDTFDEFDSPSIIVCGRVNGINNSLVYVIDKLAKRIQLFENKNKELVLLKTLQGEYENYFTSLNTDHFGNIYVTDIGENIISKYTFDLQYLDEIISEDKNKAAHFINIPFGKIEIEGEDTYWTGFDQMFTAQKWTNESGIKRHKLGTRLKDITYSSDENISAISTAFTLTDAAQVDYRVYNSDNQLVRIINNDWISAGDQILTWDRRNDNNEFVEPDNYRLEIIATSAYTEENISAEFELNLPLYYWMDSGSNIPQDDKFLVQGEKLNWGLNPTLTTNSHETSVNYRFDNLNPQSTYEIQSEYYAGDGIDRIQSMTANGFTVQENIKITDEVINTGFYTIPKESYENGYLIISISREGEGSAVVSQLWLKETGTNLTVKYIDENLPKDFQLSQNYPNPFNPTTTIEFHIPTSQNVSLKIFNILGQKVETLVQDYKKAGVHRINFNAQSLASGVYFYQIKAGHFNKNRKMILLK